MSKVDELKALTEKVAYLEKMFNESIDAFRSLAQQNTNNLEHIVKLKEEIDTLKTDQANMKVSVESKFNQYKTEIKKF